MIGRPAADVPKAMSIRPSVEEQEQLEETFRREASKMSPGEAITELLWCAGFVVAAIAVWLCDPPRGLSVGPWLACLVVLIVATRVRIDTPLGFTVPTQLAFVPLLFSVPLAVVPVTVAAGLLLARIPDLLRRTVRADRVLVTVSNAWFALGPVAVFEIAGTQPRVAGAWLLLAALLAQFTVDMLVSTVRMGADRAVGLGVQLRDAWVYAVDAALSGVGLLAARQMYSDAAAVLALLPLLAIFAIFARERHERLTGLLELNRAYRGTALVLGDVIKADDGYTGEHSRGVVELALAVGEQLGLGSDERRNLEFGALLHDLGKVAIPKEIINKPGKLDADEWAIMKTHTIEGQKMLDRVGGFMGEVGRIVRSHHERWDGRGYPDALAGDAIPLESRIISCCDAWNAMRTDRVYRPALSADSALAELRSNSGLQFDPHVVAAILDVIAPELDLVHPAADTPPLVAPSPSSPEPPARTNVENHRVRRPPRRYDPVKQLQTANPVRTGDAKLEVSHEVR
jgi:putative nucleotidyltransferase with HDIG domain